MLYRGDFWVFLNAIFWDQQKNMSSIESTVVRYRYYRIGIDTFAITIVYYVKGRKNKILLFRNKSETFPKSL